MGGISAVAIGLLNVVIILYFFNSPEAGRDDAYSFFRNFADNAFLSSLPWIVFAVTAVLSNNILPAVQDMVRGVHPDLARFATLLGLAGYTVQGVWAVTLIRAAPVLSAAFQTGDATTRAVILAVGLPQIDPDGWFSFGGPGTWLILVNLLALLGRRLPAWHAAFGVLAGICAWATVIASATGFEPQNLFASAGGAAVYPLWFVLFGIRLIRGGPDGPERNTRRRESDLRWMTSPVTGILQTAVPGRFPRALCPGTTGSRLETRRDDDRKAARRHPKTDSSQGWAAP
ncbi:MAG: DUF4386 family protein [Anaerolineales bacterium]|nr:DUF4386 family protein [Anaerolineales bacterium]